MRETCDIFQIQSEGFPRTGDLVPGRDGLGVPPDGQSSWDAAAVAVATVAAIPPTAPAASRRPPVVRMQFIQIKLGRLIYIICAPKLKLLIENIEQQRTSSRPSQELFFKVVPKTKLTS